MSNEISKRELFSRQALGAGLGVGALALMAQTRPASADSPFTSFAFLASGGATPRTMPDRLSDVKNVKDFVATRDGITNDHDAIQAAIDAVAGDIKGVVFFPPGTYKINSTLTFNSNITPNHGCIFRGVGKASIIKGNFNGFLLSRHASPESGNWGINVIEYLWFQNDNTGTSSGCIFWRDSQNLLIQACDIFTGFCGVFLETDLFRYT